MDEDLEPPSAKRVRKIKAAKDEHFNDMKLQLWKEAINIMKTNDSDEKGSDRHSNSEVNEVRSFGKLVEDTLSRFNERQRAIAKKRINDVLFELEIGDGFNMRGNKEGYQQPEQHISTPYLHHPAAHFSRFPLYQDGRSPSPTSSSCSDLAPRDSYVSGTSFMPDLQDLG